MMVMLSDTIDDVKYKIQHMEGISLEQQSLIIELESNDQCGNDFVYQRYNLGNRVGKKLSDYYIQKESTLRLVLRLRGGMQIFVHMLFGTGEFITLDVQPTDSIKSVKAKIQDKKGIPMNQQRLIIARNQETEDDDESLSFYNIHNEEKIRLL
jgi:ubiquitin